MERDWGQFVAGIAKQRNLFISFAFIAEDIGVKKAG